MTTGTQGYDRFISLFIESSREFDFHVVCADFLRFLPVVPARVLDIGSGAGQNAAELAKLGYRVVAVEPMPEFLNAAKNMYSDVPVKWSSGSLPELKCFDHEEEKFDFVLINGVWHHLDEIERFESIVRIEKITKSGSVCAISLRNGPAGMGTRVFPTDLDCTIRNFQENGFSCVFAVKSQPSVVQFKKDVEWSRVVFVKT